MVHKVCIIFCSLLHIGTIEFIHVADYNNERIQKFTSDGQFNMMWGGTYGEDDGEFKKSHGVTLDSEGNVYVSERSGLRIQKFDPDGNFITRRDSEGKANGQFLHLHDMAVATVIVTKLILSLSKHPAGKYSYLYAISSQLASDDKFINILYKVEKEFSTYIKHIMIIYLW